MRSLAIVALAVLALPAQSRSPVPDAVEAPRVLKAVETLLAAVSARDAAAQRALLRPTGTATVLIERPDDGSYEVRSFDLARWAESTPGPERHEERMIRPSVKVSGDIALVWGDYTFAIDGQVRHCGFQHFGLVRDGGRWLVQNVTWSVRTSGCAR